MATGTISLFRNSKFLPFFLTQFFGAFNDNVFKLAMLTLISYHLTHTQARSEYYQALASALFMGPFFLFSATAGELADKYDKAIIIRLIKLFEIGLMSIGSLALYCGSIFWMLATLTGLGVHSAFFGPIKYSFLPHHLPEERLLGATGLIDASTFIAILLGTTLGALSIGVKNASPYTAIFCTVLIAVAGFVASLFIPGTKAFAPNLVISPKFWNAISDKFRLVANYPSILVTCLILSWFWLFGSIILTKLPDYTNYVLRADNHVFALFLALFSIGVAIGSLLVNLIFRGRIVLAIVPWAMLAVTGFTLDLYWLSAHVGSEKTLTTLDQFLSVAVHWRIAVDLFLLAFSSGLFVVPLYTYLQVSSPPEIRAQIIAVNNIYNSLFMVAGAVAVIILLHFKVTIPEVFLILSIANALVALLILVFWKQSQG